MPVFCDLLFLHQSCTLPAVSLKKSPTESKPSPILSLKLDLLSLLQRVNFLASFSSSSPVPSWLSLSNTSFSLFNILWKIFSSFPLLCSEYPDQNCYGTQLFTTPTLKLQITKLWDPLVYPIASSSIWSSSTSKSNYKALSNSSQSSLF